MCGMFITLNQDNIPLLSEYNARRGGINETLTELDVNNTKVYVGHFQAPTSINSGSQPDILNYGDVNFDRRTRLWHNGILKESEISKLKSIAAEHWHSIADWDTALLHYAMLSGHDLSEVDGSFALFLYSEHPFFKDTERKLYFARNALAPLFMNTETLDVSSVKIPELGITKSVPHGKWFQICKTVPEFTKLFELEFKDFTTKNNPYNF